MSLELPAKALKLFSQATDAQSKGQVLRAAEKYGCAAAEAERALGSADNLVSMELRLLRADSIASFLLATEPSITLGSLRAECVALVSATVSALERRRAADTPLNGKCSAAEQAWLAYTAAALAAKYRDATVLDDHCLRTTATDAAQHAEVHCYMCILSCAASAIQILIRSDELAQFIC